MKKIILLSFCMILLVGTISAFEFDNVKNYDEETKTVEIRNSILGIPFLQLSQIMTAKLQTPHNNKVGSGYRKIAEITINSKKDYNNVFNSFTFYNLKTGKKINRQIDIKYFVTEDVEVNEYKEFCSFFGNGTRYCESIIIGKKIIEKGLWKDFDNSVKLDEEVTIGLFTNVYTGDKIEWIPKIAGVRISEWAVWTASLEAQLVSYYKLDEEVGDGGTIVDELNNYSGINNDAVSTTGKINYGYDFDGVNPTTNINISSMNLTYGNFSINCWMRPDYVNLRGAVTAKQPYGTGTPTNSWELGVGAAISRKPEFVIYNAYSVGATSLNNNTWYMLTGVYDNSTGNSTLYLNGVVDAYGSTLSTGPNQAFSNVLIGGESRASATVNFEGKIDECGYWNRDLNQSEVTQLYNGGTGISFITTTPPAVTLDAPANAVVIGTSTIDLSCTASDNVGITNVSLLWNGTIDQTNVSGFNNTIYNFTKSITTGVGLYNWSCQAYDDEDIINNTAEVRNLTFASALQITLNAPINEFNSTSSTLDFNGTASDDIAVLNVSFILNGIYNGTNSSIVNATLTNFDRSLPDGDYNWTLETCDVIGCINATARNVTIDTTLPDVLIIFPDGEISSFLIGDSLNLNWSINDTNLDSCWFQYNGVNTSLTCGDNATTFTPLIAQQSLIIYGNDSLGNLGSDSTTWTYAFLENQMLYNVSTLETAYETFDANITTNGTTMSNAWLYYNGSTYPATITNTIGDNYNVTTQMDIPTGYGNLNRTFAFNYTFGGANSSTSIYQQNVSLINLTKCDATYIYPFINYTFQDEGNSSSLEAAMVTFDIDYWAGSGTITKSYSFTNTSENLNYSFCAAPNITFSTNYSISYSSTSYPQRSFKENATFTNSVTNKILYLLHSGDGIYVTFQLINAAEQVLESVLTNITRSGNLISSGSTGADGGITYWLDPDILYAAMFYLDPYPLYSITQAFTQSSYTITLGSGITSDVSDYQRGITYSIKPTLDYLLNGTIYPFNFTIDSSYWTLEEYGFNITDGDGTFYNSTSGSTGAGSTIEVYMNTSGNETFIMNYYWTINSTNTTGIKSWLILDLSGNIFSISRLVSDFNTYVDSPIGLFGLDDFGKGLICFFIIIGATGFLKVKWGVSNTAAILGIIWALVALFDISFGILPNPVGAVSNFPTILMGIIFFGVLLKEVYK